MYVYIKSFHYSFVTVTLIISCVMAYSKNKLFTMLNSFVPETQPIWCDEKVTNSTNSTFFASKTICFQFNANFTYLNRYANLVPFPFPHLNFGAMDLQSKDTSLNI